MPEHNELIGAQLHPPQPLTFTGAVGSYTPPSAGVLAVRTDVEPRLLYVTTGTTAGALVPFGTEGVGATIAIGNVTAEPEDVLITVNDSGTTSAAVLDFDFNFSGLPVSGSAVPLIAAPPAAPPDPLPASGTAALALETSTPPVLWAYDGAAWSFVAMTSQSSGGPDDPDVAAWAALLTGSYSSAELEAVETFVLELKGRTLADGGSQWASLQGLWLRCLDNIEDSRLNIKGETYTLSDIDSPSFTARQGITLNGTSQRFGTGLNAFSVSPSNPNGVVGAYVRTNIQWGFPSVRRIAGAWAGGGLETRISYDLSNLAGAINADQNVSIGTSDPRGASTITGIADEENEYSLIHNQADATGFFFAEAESIDAELFFGALTENGDFPSNFFEGQIAAGWAGFGKKWTVAEAKAFHADLETLLDAFGAGVID